MARDGSEARQGENRNRNPDTGRVRLLDSDELQTDREEIRMPSDNRDATQRVLDLYNSRKKAAAAENSEESDEQENHNEEEDEEEDEENELEGMRRVCRSVRTLLCDNARFHDVCEVGFREGMGSGGVAETAKNQSEATTNEQAAIASGMSDFSGWGTSNGNSKPSSNTNSATANISAARAVANEDSQSKSNGANGVMIGTTSDFLETPEQLQTALNVVAAGIWILSILQQEAEEDAEDNDKFNVDNDNINGSERDKSKFNAGTNDNAVHTLSSVSLSPTHIAKLQPLSEDALLNKRILSRVFGYGISTLDLDRKLDDSDPDSDYHSPGPSPQSRMLSSHIHMSHIAAGNGNAETAGIGSAADLYVSLEEAEELFSDGIDEFNFYNLLAKPYFEQLARTLDVEGPSYLQGFGERIDADLEGLESLTLKDLQALKLVEGDCEDDIDCGLSGEEGELIQSLLKGGA